MKTLIDSGYSEKAITLYLKNVNLGTLEKPNFVTTSLGPCGDLITLYLRINESNIIEKVRFNCRGCIGSVVSASAMATLLRGKALDKAKEIDVIDILDELGGLPESELDYVKLSIRTLRKAISEYEIFKGSSKLKVANFEKFTEGKFA